METENHTATCLIDESACSSPRSSNRYQFVFSWELKLALNSIQLLFPFVNACLRVETKVEAIFAVTSPPLNFAALQTYETLAQSINLWCHLLLPCLDDGSTCRISFA
jgi:hypothetical protein